MCIRSARCHAMWTPRAVGHVGDVMGSDLSCSGHLGLRQRLGRLNDSILIDIHEITCGQLLLSVNVRGQWSITDILVALLILAARLTNKIIWIGRTYGAHKTTMRVGTIVYGTGRLKTGSVTEVGSVHKMGSDGGVNFIFK